MHSDLGISRISSNTQTMTAVGSVAWTAPEILRKEHYNEKVDVYSYGNAILSTQTTCTQHNTINRTSPSHYTTPSHHTAPLARVTHNPAPCLHTNHVGNPVANQTHQHTPSHLRASPRAHPRHLSFPPLSPATPHHGNKTGCYMFVFTYLRCRHA